MENKSEISTEKLNRSDFFKFKTQIFITPINKNSYSVANVGVNNKTNAQCY